MYSWRKNLFWIWLSLFLAMAGFAFVYPITPFFLKDVYGVVDQQQRDVYISLLVFSNNFGFLLFSPLWGRLSDIYGRKMMMARASACAAFFIPFMAIMPSPEWLIGLRFLIGSFAGVAAAAMTLVACTTPEAKRGMAMGAISSAIFSGNLAGVVLGGLCASELGYNWTFGVCSFIMFLSAFIAFFFIYEDKSTLVKGEVKILPSFKLPKLGLVWYLLLLTLIMGLVQCLDNPFVPVMVDMVLHEGSAMAMRWNGIMGGACAAAGVVGGFVLGAISDRYSGNKVGIVIAIISAVFLFPQMFCESFELFFIERVLMTFFISGLSPVMQSWLSLTTESSKRGIIFGYATSVRAMGWLIGGLTGMGVTYGFGTRSIFAVGALSLLFMAFSIWYVNRRIPFPDAKMR